MHLDNGKPVQSCCGISRSSAGNVTQERIRFQQGADAKVDKTGMVYIPGGSFLMGTDDREGFPSDGEGPIHEVTAAPFTWTKSR